MSASAFTRHLFKSRWSHTTRVLHSWQPSYRFSTQPTIITSGSSPRAPRSSPTLRGPDSNSRRYPMRRAKSPHSSPERASKRRRTSPTTPHRKAKGNMTPTPLHSSPKLQLTPIENTLKSLLLDVAEYIRQQAIANGASEADAPRTVLRFTGGWVRDKLLGTDSHDVDVGINNMTGYQFGKHLRTYLEDPQNLRKYRDSLPDGELKNDIVRLHKIEANPEKSKHLETVTTKIFGLDVDLVNLRKETYSEDSRNPQMEFGTAEEDALRRDATINALFYNLNESRVEDLTGRGFEDMEAKIIRTPMEPYQTFKDDPLRVLRLIRFASRLGYRIDTDTEGAMQNGDIREALKLKISRERVGAEVEKMLRGPDPHGALHFFDRLKLYTTIFANHQDDARVDTSSWSLAYDSMQQLLHPTESTELLKRVHTRLIRNELDKYYGWTITAFAPWTSVAGRVAKGPKAKPLPPRATEVARDSLKSDNKTTGILSDASNAWSVIIDVKNSVLDGRMEGSPAEIRQQVGLHMRSWKKEWRLCMLLAILQETMQGAKFLDVITGYDKFLEYIVAQDLEDVTELNRIVNGGEIMKFLGVRNGPWMGRALEMTLEWQLLHPEITDKNQALEYLARRKGEFGLE